MSDKEPINIKIGDEEDHIEITKFEKELLFEAVSISAGIPIGKSQQDVYVSIKREDAQKLVDFINEWLNHD